MQLNGSSKVICASVVFTTWINLCSWYLHETLTPLILSINFHILRELIIGGTFWIDRHQDPLDAFRIEMVAGKLVFQLSKTECVPATRKVQTARQKLFEEFFTIGFSALWGIFHKLFSLNICLDEFLSFCNLVHFLWNPVWLWRSMCLKLNQKSLNCQVAQRLFMCFPSTSGCYRFLYFQMSPFCEGLSKHFWILSFLVLSSESIL